MDSYLQPLATLVIMVVAGIASLILAEKLRLPSILFLLVFGVLLGPEFANLIQPDVFQPNFSHYISLMVALILFEGGASLKFSQFREISLALRRLLTVGVVVTLAGMTLAAHYVADLSWRHSLLFGAIMIVTGPTVIQPILQRLRVRGNLHNLLKWEGILVDPLGVVISVVLFEFLLSRQIGVLGGLGLFLGRIVLGVVLGLLAGWIAHTGLSKNWLLRLEGEELGGLFLLAVNLLFYGLAEAVLPHSGLVAAATAGIYVGNKPFLFQDQIFHFEKQITMFALSILFILLSSSVPVSSAAEVTHSGGIVLLLALFVVRPASVFLSTWKDPNFTLKEKTFMSLIAPRGIVSASLASLFALEFDKTSLPGGAFLPLTFLVIAGTIVGYVVITTIAAKVLKVEEVPGKNIVIVGANPLALMYGEEFRNRGLTAVFIDTNRRFCDRARRKKFEAHLGNAFDREYLESLDLKGVGAVIACTPNHEANVLSCQAFSGYLGRGNVYRLWDKTDTWEAATATTYDESWGKPLLVSQKGLDQDLLEIAEQRKSQTAVKKLEQPIKTTPASLDEQGLTFPLFAWHNEEVVFPTANRALSVETDVIHLQPAP